MEYYCSKCFEAIALIERLLRPLHCYLKSESLESVSLERSHLSGFAWEVVFEIPRFHSDYSQVKSQMRSHSLHWSAEQRTDGAWMWQLKLSLWSLHPFSLEWCFTLKVQSCSAIAVVFVQKGIAFGVMRNKRLRLGCWCPPHFERYCLKPLD